MSDDNIKDEIIKKQAEYIKWLDDATHPFVSFCWTHGMKVSKEVFEEGKQQREYIKSLKEKLNKPIE